jgi:small subunit ribosomal protein S2
MLTNWQTIQLSIKKIKIFRNKFNSWTFRKLPKKEGALLLKQYQKLDKYLGGMKNMDQFPIL